MQLAIWGESMHRILRRVSGRFARPCARTPLVTRLDRPLPHALCVLLLSIPLAATAAEEQQIVIEGEVASPEEVADLERQRDLASEAGDEDEARALEEMVVTARKREENLQETPVTITAIGAGQLQDISARRLDDIGRLVPNLQLDTGAGGAQSASVLIAGRPRVSRLFGSLCFRCSGAAGFP
jgi:outer membrane receptor protein involved in Fe transport